MDAVSFVIDIFTNSEGAGSQDLVKLSTLTQKELQDVQSDLHHLKQVLAGLQKEVVTDDT